MSRHGGNLFLGSNKDVILVSYRAAETTLQLEVIQPCLSEANFEEWYYKITQAARSRGEGRHCALLYMPQTTAHV